MIKLQKSFIYNIPGKLNIVLVYTTSDMRCVYVCFEIIVILVFIMRNICAGQTTLGSSVVDDIATFSTPSSHSKHGKYKTY